MPLVADKLNFKTELYLVSATALTEALLWQALGFKNSDQNS
jgi:hypothetical protein